MAVIGINATALPEHPTGAARWQYHLLTSLQEISRPADWQFLLFLPQNVASGHPLTDAVPGFFPSTFPIRSDSSVDRLIVSPAYSYLRATQQHADLLFTFQHPVFPAPVPSVMVIYDVRFLLQPDTYTPARRLFLQLVVPTSLRLAAHIITISEATKNDLVELLYIDPDKIDVVYPGVGSVFTLLDPHSDQIARTRDYLQHQGIDGRFMLAVGHIEPRKNYERLIQALPALYERLQERVPLVIVGAQYSFNRTNLVAQSAALGVQDMVIFADRVNDDLLVGLYNQCSVYTLPSTHEGFGMTLLEAMACGAPIVTSTAGSLPEVASDAAILVDPSSVDSIANGLFEVLSDGSRATALRAAGHRRVSHFSWHNAAQHTLNIFCKVLNRSRSCNFQVSL